MANIIKRIWNQNKMVNIEALQGMAFQAEDGGHTFQISGVNDAGEAVPLSGTVAGVFMRADRADIALTGSASGGVVSVTLNDDCYAVPGRFGLTIFVTSGGQKTAVYAAVGTVSVTSGGGVAGETPQNVVDLINAIAAAVATIPASYTDLMTAIAPVYSSSALYPLCAYSWYGGHLYRCTTPITTAETWTAAHWTAAVLGDDVGDLKSALDNSFNYGIDAAIGVNPARFYRGVYKTVATGESVVWSDDDEFTCTKIPVSEGDIIDLDCAGSSGIYRLWVTIDVNGKAVARSATNLIGKRKIVIPSGVAEIAINNYLPTMATGYYAAKDNSFVANESNVSYRLTEFYQGAISSTGEDGNSDVYCKTDYISYDAISRIYKPVGIFVIANFFSDKSSGSFITRDTAKLDDTNDIDYSGERFRAEFQVTGAKYVRFSIARYESDSELNSTPQDIINSDLSIDIAGCSDEIYQIINECNKPHNVSHYYDFRSGTVASSGDIAASTDYWRTEMIPIGEINRLIKPTGLNAMVSRFDSNGSFIARSSIAETEAVDYDRQRILYLYGENTSYLIISVAKYNATVEGTAPVSIDDILASGFELFVTSSTDEIKEKLFQKEENKLPEYYFTTGYLDGRINEINRIEDSISTECDEFIFLTDYHFSQNAERSPAIIKRIVGQTGITRLVFGGDAGRSQLAANKYMAARENCGVFQKLLESVSEFYGVVGNHDWNDRQDTTHEGAKQAEVFSTAGIMNFYLGEQRTRVDGMSSEGDYYIDNKAAKIRYFFLQETGQAKTTNETIEWLGNQLLNTPTGYYVVVFCHYAYTGAPNGTFDPSSIIGRGNLSVIRISQILGAVKEKTSVTVKKYNRYDTSGTQSGSLTFDFTGTDLTPIAIISGHTHWDASLTTSQSDYGILTIATTTDAAGYAQNGQTGAAEPRTVGTIEEQAFDVVHIDLTARKVYMTRIGGGSDREFTF